MRQFMHPHAVSACAAIGAVGVTAVAVGAHPAAAAETHSPAPSAGSFTDAIGRQLTITFPGGALFGSRAHPGRQAPGARDTTAIASMVAAGDRIARLPYVYGGGHGSFSASGYDCSGSVSYVLHSAGLLSTPLDSSALESFGDPGPGRHVTIYANSGHAWMTIDGRRYDTIALQETGTRWSSTISSSSSYVVRHPRGL